MLIRNKNEMTKILQESEEKFRNSDVESAKEEIAFLIKSFDEKAKKNNKESERKHWLNNKYSFKPSLKWPEYDFFALDKFHLDLFWT